MPPNNKETEELPDDLGMLDDLIRRYYRELLHTISENAKLGEFLKMIELRRKMAPADQEQKQFWKMLEQIRKEELRSNNKSVALPPAAKRSRKKQVSE